MERSEVRDTRTVLRGFVSHAEVGMGHHQFRSLYLGFHPATGDLVVHEGQTARLYTDGIPIYSMELLGSPPRAGGDTHGAMTHSRDILFFGGWVKAPPGILDGRQDMRNKYSHIHSLDEKGKVELLWSRKWDNNLDTSHWYGEVTDMIYDEHEDAIYFSRADGHAELGLWRINLSVRRAEQLIDGQTLYKMELKDDKLYATEFNPTQRGESSILVYDLHNDTQSRFSQFKLGVEPEVTVKMHRIGGQIVQFQNNILAFYRGFLLLARPGKDWVELYPFMESCSPEDGHPFHVGGVRSQKVYLDGIPLIAMNPWDHIREVTPRSEVGLLVRVDGGLPQLVASMGHVSGIATDGREIYLGTSYADHTGVYTNRAGEGGVFAIPVREFLRVPWVPMRFTLWEGPYAQDSGIAGWFGGVPMKGFHSKRVKMYVDEDCVLTVREQLLTTKFTEDKFSLHTGWNRLDLSSYTDLVSFKLNVKQRELTFQLSMELER